MVRLFAASSGTFVDEQVHTSSRASLNPIVNQDLPTRIHMLINGGGGHPSRKGTKLGTRDQRDCRCTIQLCDDARPFAVVGSGVLWGIRASRPGPAVQGQRKMMLPQVYTGPWHRSQPPNPPIRPALRSRDGNLRYAHEPCAVTGGRRQYY